ncbi:hypothetical protein BDV59DRAFT_194325 [Aspergillus ambiguus]|uniref:uncharacterized protein n=1 Tax=Aspergillus ambiguus TaxID=176160 RepID=UPI003CCD227D
MAQRPGSDLLDKRGLREFVQGLGNDVDELRRLERNQADYVLDGIYEVGMVDFVTPMQDLMDHASLPSEIDSASLADAMSQSNTTTLVDGLTSLGPSNPGMDAGNEFDHLLNALYDSRQCVRSTAAKNTVGGEWPTGMAMAPEPVLIDDQIDTTVSLFTSLDSDDSPSVDQQLSFLDPGNTPHPTRSSVDYASTPDSVATLGSERGTSPYYMTPPTSVGSPLGVQPIDPRWAFSSNSTLSHAVHDWRDNRISGELQCCRFREKKKKDSPSDEDWGTLGSKQISHIIKAWDYILPQGSIVCVRELPEKNASMSVRQVLGLPEVWEGIEGAVNYFRVLEADKDGLSTLGPLARRFAQIFLYLNFEMLSMDGDGTVVNRVLDACHDEPNIAQSRESRRNRFSGIHVRRGRWWWGFAASLGFGILLVADSQLIQALSSGSFKNGHIDAFITCVLRTRPGTVRFFESLEPVVMFLLYGNALVDIRQKLEDTGLLRRDAINRALEEDQEALALQWTWNIWEAKKTETSANESKTKFLASIRPSG